MAKCDRFSSRASRVPRSRPDLRIPRSLWIASVLVMIMETGTPPAATERLAYAHAL